MPAGWTSGPSRQSRRRSRRGRSARAQLAIDRKYEEPWSGQLPARIMVLASGLPGSAGASGAISSRFISGGCGEAAPEQMAKVPEFPGDGEVTSL
jgi:hypothetical protein